MNLMLIVLGSLVSIMNPIGTVPVFVSLTQSLEIKPRNKVAFWTSINVMFILFISFFLGEFILTFFGISLNSLKIAGGLIIAASGFALLKGEFNKHKGMKKKMVVVEEETKTDISLTPLAIPMIAGPGTISMLITYNQEYTKNDEILYVVIAMILACGVIYLTLKSSFFIVKLLGSQGINALSRIIGFIIISIGVELITSSVINILKLK